MNSMKSFRRWFAQHCPLASCPAPRRRGLRGADVERLEQRLLMTVTNHGGPVIAHVEIQALYYGSDWQTDPKLKAQAAQLDAYLKFVTNSSYMDMLTNAGYGVFQGGPGNAAAGDTLAVTVNKTKFVTDTTIQKTIESEVKAGKLVDANTNRLYVVFTEPGVKVKIHGYNSSHGRTGSSSHGIAQPGCAHRN